MKENRSGQDLSNSLICTGQDGNYALPAVNVFYKYPNGNYDVGIFEVTNTNTGVATLFFKQTLNVCTVGETSDCNQINDGRGTNMTVPYVRLSGLVASCDVSSLQMSTIVLYPAAGQTLKELQEAILILCVRQ